MKENRLYTCKYCFVDTLIWSESDGKWILMEKEGQIHKCNIDAVIKNKIATHKMRYKSFDDDEFAEWLFLDYLKRDTPEEAEKIKNFVAFVADISKLNKKRKVGLSIEKYAIYSAE